MSAVADIFNMLTKEQKKQIVEELADRIKRQQSLIFTDVTGVNVSGIQDLRRKLREAEIEYKIAKKNLIKLALEKEKKDMNIDEFKGSLGLAFSYKDPIRSAKILDNFSKEHKEFKILGGIMENKVLAIEDIEELAKIPSKDELLAMFIGSLKAPITNFANILQGSTRNLLLILKQIHG
jgi:large subunit ribosomal protein L10